MQVVLNLKDFENDYFSVCVFKGKTETGSRKNSLEKCFER